MRTWVLVVALGAFVLVVLAHEASANTNALSGSCATIDIGTSPSVGDRNFQLYATGASECAASGATPKDIVSASSITLTCVQNTNGISPPGVPDAGGITIRAYADNVGFPNGAGQFFSSTANTCGATTTTIYCSSDGTNGGAARYGVVRIYIAVVKTGVGSYSDNSDQGSGTNDIGGYGIFRCDPNITAVNSTSGAGAVHTFVGGDTITMSLTANAATLGSPASVLSPVIICGSSFTQTSFSPTTSATTQTATIIGSPATWIDDCTLHFTWTVVPNAQLSGFTTVPWIVFNVGSIPALTATDAKGLNLYLNNSQVVDRTLTNSAATCGPQVNSVPRTVVNRGQTVTMSCLWSNARGVSVANGKFATVWVERAGLYRDTTDFPSNNPTIFSGLFLSSNQARGVTPCGSCATTTTGLAYHEQGDYYDTSARTDAVLLNWGNTTGQLDVSSVMTFTGINDAKTSGGANQSCSPCAFTIGVDLQFIQPQGLTDAGAQLVSGADVTCFRTLPRDGNEATSDLGNTDASGNAPEKQLNVVAPPGLWTLTCNATPNGNSATYVITFFFVSPFTGNVQGTVLWNVTLNVSATSANGTNVYDANVSAGFKQYDQASDSVKAMVPDDTPKLTVFRYNATSDNYDVILVNRTPMRQNDGGTFYDFRWSTNASNLTVGDFAYVTTNFTGAPFMGGQAFILKENLTGNFSGNVSASSNGPWESQAHANATWCNVVNASCTNSTFANATFEGQVHANATWCANPCAAVDDDSAFVSNGYANGTFEGQAHANATWCPAPACAINGSGLESQAHANATWCNVVNASCTNSTFANATFEGQAHANSSWESQVHANATWCPIVGAKCSGNYSGNFTGNFSGMGSGNFTGNFTVLDALGTLTVSTVLDPYVPIIFFGGLMIMFLWINAWLPGMAAAMGLGNAILPTPTWTFAASIILLAICIIIQFLAKLGAEILTWALIGEPQQR